ncbi:MAG: hypothetical protein HY665_02980 [Chloroflexi bacterium]|nr:hypothetical protein [Chloroflexota bacterium]
MTLSNANIADSALRRAARSRLYVELAGLAFAVQKGFSPEEYARHLWSKGAARWMGKTSPDAAEYLLKEAEAFQCLFPSVVFEVIETGKESAELAFVKGCLGGWGKDPWNLARSLGLTKENVCRYCRESFRVWAEQLGLDAHTEPQENGTCRLRAVRRKSSISKP